MNVAKKSNLLVIVGNWFLYSNTPSLRRKGFGAERGKV